MKLDDITQKQVMIGMATAVFILSMIVIIQSYMLIELTTSSRHLLENSIESQITIIDKTWICTDFQDYSKMLGELQIQDSNYKSSPLDQHIIDQGKKEGCL